MRKFTPVEREIMMWCALVVLRAILIGAALTAFAYFAFGLVGAVFVGVFYTVYIIRRE